jgi:hypothetical protein
MGASDQPARWAHDGVPQQLVTTLYDGSETAQQDLLQHLKHYGIDTERRVAIHWDTWKGTYLTPPDDALPWTADELRSLETAAAEHPNVVAVDYSEGGGSQG